MELKDEIILDGSQARWYCNQQGAINGTYIGEFVFRCYLNPAQRLAAGREYRELLGTNLSLASDAESFLAFALSQLRYRIIQAPPFWVANGGEIADEEVVTAVLNAAVTAEEKYKESVLNRKKEALEKARKAAEAIVKAKEAEKKASGVDESIDEE